MMRGATCLNCERGVRVFSITVEHVRAVTSVTCGPHCALLQFTHPSHRFYSTQAVKNFVFCPNCVQLGLSLNSSE